MGNLYNNKWRAGIFNELIKSQKQVKTGIKCSELTDCIISQPMLFADDIVQEVVFRRVSFAAPFVYAATEANTVLIIEDCIFMDSAEIVAAPGIRVIIRNTIFQKELSISNTDPHAIEMYGVSSDVGIQIGFIADEEVSASLVQFVQNKQLYN